MRDADVAVVGGGLAGLETARRLAAAGVSVLVLEARDRLGGRTWTERFGGSAFDCGGQWIGPGQPRMYQLVKELGLELFPTYVEGKKILDRSGSISTYGGTIPFYHPLKLLSLSAILSSAEWRARSIPRSEPWRAKSAAELDAITVESWRGRAGKDVRGVFDAAVRTIFGADPGELSLLHFLWYVSSNDGLMRLVETAGGYQQDRIVGGTQQISERLADRIGRERIRLGAPVRRIVQDREGVVIESSAGSSRVLRAVVAVPLAIAGRIDFEPQLPPIRDQLHQRVAMGSTVKILVRYQEPFWRERGLSGEAVSTAGPIAVTFDNTSHDGKSPCLVAFVVGRPARTFSSAPAEQRRERILSELARFFGPLARQPIDYREIDWGEERFSGGCPIGNFPPGTLSVFGEALRTPIGRIHFAGTETARESTGYMEGALESGERAAAEVLGERSFTDECKESRAL